MRIVHVEDDPDIREIVALSLDLCPELSLAQYPSGQALLDALPKQPPDVFLLDQMMPGLSGIETLQRLRDRPHMRHVPAIFMTARSCIEINQLTNETPQVGIIAKPIDPVQLGQQIKSLAHTLKLG